jgi:hypothetical protein
MTVQADGARTLWRDLANAPGGFDQSLVVVESVDHRSSPDGWVSVVTLEGATVIATPPGQLRQVHDLIEAVGPERLADHAYVASLAHPARTLGPARLFYDGTPQRTSSVAVVGPLSITDSHVARVLDDASAEERAETDLEDATSGIYVALDANQTPAAICGWRRWPHDVAHIGVLCARSKRGTGAALRASNQALRAAAADGLLAQWRAAEQNASSIQLARALGLSELGSQLSLEFSTV